MENENAALGKVISLLRQKANLSQEALADLAGIHRTYVSQLERGLKSPTLAILMRIARALDIRASRILEILESENAEV